ncbi:hypothetical protein [Micromonospora avicenniae]|uniref:hypothetical protein n=1 Tax=Micromonospora avicenniae TaxID=1198245 RepID=UPI0034455776
MADSSGDRPGALPPAERAGRRLYGLLGALVREFEAALRHTVPTADFDDNNTSASAAALPAPATVPPDLPVHHNHLRPGGHPARRRPPPDPASGRGQGYHIPDAILAAAQHLTGNPGAHDLVEAIKVLADHLTDQANPAFKQMAGSDLIRWHGMFTPTDVITMALYAAAAQHDGCEFEPSDFTNRTH